MYLSLIQIKKFNDKGILVNLKNKYGELSLNNFNDITVFMYGSIFQFGSERKSKDNTY